MNRIQMTDEEKKIFLQTTQLVTEPKWTRVFAKVVGYGLLLFIVFISFTPWQQTSQGAGQIIAIDPTDRIQDVNATVPGRLNRWFVTDGSVVKKGDPIVEIVDNDPLFIDRLRVERDAVLKRFEAAKAASETAYLNFKRQKDLFEQGLSARTKFEKAKIEYKKLLASEASAAANLAKAEVKFSRQQTQLITAPRSGTILRVLHGQGQVMVKEGDVLAIFVPDTKNLAAEIFVPGNDLPLIYPGRKVRLQFEGWPAIQFSGWPSVSVGTFSGVVKSVDPSASYKGRFRVIVTPDPESRDWPDRTFLRQETRVFAWILLNEVSIGYEFWRQFNGFPPVMNAPPERISNSKASKDKKKKKEEDEKEYGDEKKD